MPSTLEKIGILLQLPLDVVEFSRSCDIYHNISHLIKEFNNSSHIFQFEIE